MWEDAARCTVVDVVLSEGERDQSHASNKLAYRRMLLDALFTRAELETISSLPLRKVRNQVSTDTEWNC